MDNGQIKHTDIAEVGVMKPFQDELIATIQIINTMDADLISIAKSLKKALSDGTTTSTDAIRKQTEAVKQSKEAMSLKEIQTKELAKAQAKLDAVTDEGARTLAQYNLKIQEATRENREFAKASSDQIGAYEKASMKLNQLTKEWKNLAIVQQENTVRGKELKKQIDELDATLKKVDYQTGKFSRNVGNYKSGFNGLGNSINQLTRELPSIGNSFQTFTMAISNNVPMLADQISILKATNAELIANGGKAIPIWKQLGSAIFSFNTLISLAITATTVFGKEIGEFLKNLFKSSSAVDAMAESTQRLKDVQDKATASAVEENVKLTILLKTAQDHTLSLQDRKKAVDELQATYPSYLGNLSDEQILAGDTAKAEMELRNAILSKAKAQASTTAIVENEKKRLELLKSLKEAEVNLNDKLARQETAMQRLKGDRTGSESIAMMTQSATQSAISARKEVENLRTEIKILDNENNTLLNNIVKVQPIVNTLVKDNNNLGDKNIKNNKELVKSKKEVIKVIEDEIEAVRKQEYAEVGLVNAKQVSSDAEKKLFAIGKQRKEQAKAESDLIDSGVALLQKNANKSNEIKQRQIDNEINLNKQRIEDLKNLAIRGSQDASNNLVFEERKQAELEAKREKALKNQKKQELLFAGLKAYSANVERNPNTALVTTLKDLTMLTTALSALPSFLEGTEDTGQGGNLDSKGGFKAILHPNERVLTKDQNKKLGDISNEELATIGNLYNKGLLTNSDFDRVPMSRYVDDRLIVKTEQMFNEIKDLKEIIKNRPSQNIQYDELSKIATETIKSQFKSESTSRKIGGLRG